MFNNMSNTELLKLFAPLIALEMILMVFCLFKLRKDKVRFLPKWAWALIIILIHTLGPLSYLIIGRERD